MKTKIFLLTLGMFVFSSCGVIDSIKPEDKLSGNQSPQGEVGNTFTLGSIPGISNGNIKVSALENGISTIDASLTISDSKFLEIAKTIPKLNWNGNTVTISKKYKFTDEGIQSVYDEGNLTLVKYNDNVGKEYSLKVGSNTIKRKIEEKSTVDDYAWGFMDIKVIRVAETGRGIAGISKIEYILNHKFGVVGFKVYFEDGSEKEVRFFSQN
ncbi:hypothetical protein EGI22_11135 [Lacihabitans sp. LS3-19]|uniref:hypothetical protein n=1 Tax=Lacihabitans sp. LS3-19 TaxID=2487335 RepID=UPI0020CBF2F0|nr:hypothetical protein [Lacihabitans sp. LS3-19]MCP9768468.1 hypothetical protein [Lacihabitans sp. LS3-19]